MNLTVTLFIILAFARVYRVSSQTVKQPQLSLIDERHGSNYHERNADVNFSRTKSSYLQNSACQPESDGYFGSTSGSPAVIEYVYEMEITESAVSDQINEQIHDYIVNSILSDAFPAVCGEGTFRKLSLFHPSAESKQTQITGFYFLQATEDADHKCKPELLSRNTCTVYSGLISIYGRNLEKSEGAANVLKTTLDALDNSLSFASRIGAARINVVQQLSRLLFVPPSETSSLVFGMTPDMLIALTAALVTLIIGTIALAIFLKISWNNRSSSFYPTKPTPDRKLCCQLLRGSRSTKYHHTHNTIPSYDYSYDPDTGISYEHMVPTKSVNRNFSNRSKPCDYCDSTDDDDSETLPLELYRSEFSLPSITESSISTRGTNYSGSSVSSKKKVSFDLGGTISM